MKRIMTFLLISVLLLGICSCYNADDEQSAAEQDVTSDSSVQDTQTEQKEEDAPPVQNETSDSTPENKEPDNQEQPMTDGVHNVVFDFGYADLTVVKSFKDIVYEPATERDGFIFEGWYNGEQKWDFKNDKLTGDITLKAKWTPRQYDITYVKGDATLPENYPQYFTPLTETIKLEPAVKEGRVFVAWQITSATKTIIANEITKGTVGNLILRPIWDENLITLGTYKQDEKGTKKEKIVWQKLGEKDGKGLFITKDIIDAGAYNSATGSHIKWESCQLRKWLNSNFYNTAFSAADKEKIFLSDLTTPGEYDGSVTQDYVFALSYEEAGEYMEKYEDRQAAATDYAVAQGCAVGEGYGWWWLRTKVNDKKAAMVENIGRRQIVGYEVKVETIGIRPAIWVDLSKL